MRAVGMIVVLIISCCIGHIHGMAVWMTKEECHKPLHVGSIIMGSAAVLSEEMLINVYRDNGAVELHSGDKYVPGEELIVVLHGPEQTGMQFVFEATNAVFNKGGCDGTRVANTKSAVLKLPIDASTTSTVDIIAGWATGYTTVNVTPTFSLVRGEATPTQPSASANDAADSVKADVVNKGVKQSLRGSSSGDAASAGSGDVDGDAVSPEDLGTVMKSMNALIRDIQDIKVGKAKPSNSAGRLERKRVIQRMKEAIEKKRNASIYDQEGEGGSAGGASGGESSTAGKFDSGENRFMKSGFSGRGRGRGRPFDNVKEGNLCQQVQLLFCYCLHFQLCII